MNKNKIKNVKQIRSCFSLIADYSNVQEAALDIAIYWGKYNSYSPKPKIHSSDTSKSLNSPRYIPSKNLDVNELKITISENECKPKKFQIESILYSTSKRLEGFRNYLESFLQSFSKEITLSESIELDCKDDVPF